MLYFTISHITNMQKMVAIFLFQTVPNPKKIILKTFNQYFIPIKIKKKNDTFISGSVYIFKQ